MNCKPYENGYACKIDVSTSAKPTTEEGTKIFLEKDGSLRFVKPPKEKESRFDLKKFAAMQKREK